MSQFQFGLYGDMKDLLLTMPDPMTLSQAITQVMHYDNQFFERLTRKTLGTITNIEAIHTTQFVT